MLSFGIVRRPACFSILRPCFKSVTVVYPQTILLNKTIFLAANSVNDARTFTPIYNNGPYVVMACDGNEWHVMICFELELKTEFVNWINGDYK